MMAVVEASQLAGEILDMDAGPAVDVRWILVGQNGDAHEVALRRG